MINLKSIAERGQKVLMFRRDGRSFIILCAAAVLLLSCLTTEAITQGDKYSFRLRGLGPGLYGLVDDLYSDLSFNPAYIRRYQGSTLFTNISNLQGKTEQRQFNQDEAALTLLRSTDIFPSNLIGTITDRFGAPFGIFYESQGYNVSLQDETTDETFGSAISGISDGTKSMLKADFSGHSITFIGLIKDFGVSLSYHRLGLNMSIDDEDFSRTFTVNDSTGLRENTESTASSTRRGFEFPNSMIAFSIGRVIKYDDTELSIAAGRRPERITFNANDLFSIFKEPFFGGGSDKLSRLEEKELGYMEVGINTYFLNMRLKSIKPSLNSIHQNNILFKYERFGLPLSIEAAEKTVHDSLGINGTSRKVITDTNISISNGGGNVTLNNIEFGGGFERHINNFQTMIAFGVKLNYIWGELDFVLGPGNLKESHEVNVVVGGDPSEEAESYIRTISDNRERVTYGSLKGMFLSIPVGFETKITKKFTLRLGARSVIPVFFKTDWDETTTDGVDELIESDEEQPSFTPDTLVPTVKMKRMNIDAKSINLDSYHFGARYKVNDAVSIDLLHFAKLTQLDTWWLSVTFNY